MSATYNQTEVVKLVDEALQEVAFRLARLSVLCGAAVVKLPHTNEINESVVHRDNLSVLHRQELLVKVVKDIAPRYEFGDALMLVLKN